MFFRGAHCTFSRTISGQQSPAQFLLITSKLTARLHLLPLSPSPKCLSTLHSGISFSLSLNVSTIFIVPSLYLIMQFNLTPDPLPSMCVITDLFDISEEDWFTSRLDKSPSRTSSLQHPHSDTNSGTNQTQPVQQSLSQNLEPDHLQIELLTPDSDTIQNSFNVLTAQSDHSQFPQSLEHHFHPDLSIHLTNPTQTDHTHSPTHEDLIIDHNQLLNYATLNPQNHPHLTQNNTLETTSLPEAPITPDQQFTTDPPLSPDSQSLHEIFETADGPLQLPTNLSIQDAVTPTTPTSPAAEPLSFDDFYTALSTNPVPLPDVHTYITTLTEPLEPVRKTRRKRKLSKREAARAASAAELEREQQLAILANTKQITDDELLRLKPKKQRRAARFDKPVPSRFCHVCSRTPKNVRLVVCCKIKEGVCRKVICEKCFEEYKWGDFGHALNTHSSDWVCPHCSGNCPERAQCRTYQRINDRLRVNRLKQEGPRTGRRRVKRQMEEKVESSDEKRPRFLLPAPSEFGGFDVVNQTMEVSSLAGREISVADGLE